MRSKQKENRMITWSEPVQGCLPRRHRRTPQCLQAESSKRNAWGKPSNKHKIGANLKIHVRVNGDKVPCRVKKKDEYSQSPELARRRKTFVLHAPLKLADDRLAGEVVKEWLRVDWYLLQESVQELTAKIIGTRHSPTLQLVSKVWTLARRRAGFLNRRYRADLGVGSTKASESHWKKDR